MITVKKKGEFTITLDGESVRELADVCELARMHLREHPGLWNIGGMGVKEVQNARAFIDEIQHKTMGVE